MKRLGRFQSFQKNNPCAMGMEKTAHKNLIITTPHAYNYMRCFHMGTKGLDFKHKEVINITDGRRMGYVQDVTADLESGIITSIMVARKRIDMLDLNLKENALKIAI